MSPQENVMFEVKQTDKSNKADYKEATQNRARNDDLLWAARQPKVMTTNCLNLEEWIGVMFPRAKPSHKESTGVSKKAG